MPLPNLLPAGAIEEFRPDGLLFTGGNDLATVPAAQDPAPERDAFEAALLAYASAHSLPVLGVCRGMQSLVHLHGGTLVPVAGHVAARHRIQMRDPAPVGLSAAADAAPERNSFHRVGVLPSGLPAGFHGWAFAPDGTVEAMSGDDGRVIGVLWHPEREPQLSRDDAHLIATHFGAPTCVR